MSTSPRLAITIPTYNRADLLGLLLDSIARDFTGRPWPTDLELVVIDNASTDSTIAEVERRIAAGLPVRLVRNATNMGMDANLAACFDVTVANYLWQLGDDEVLYEGTASWVLEFCRTRDFGLLHMESIGFRKGEQPLHWARRIPERIETRELSARGLFRCANVFLTFISANVINRHAILAQQPNFNAREEMNTYLPQLVWIFGALKAHDRHFHVDMPMFGALSGNSGGYRLIEVFGTNLLAITERQLSGTLQDASSIMANAVLSRLIPSELSAQRDGVVAHNSFEKEPLGHALERAFGRRLYLRLFVLPLLSRRRWIHHCSFFMTRMFNKLNRKVRYAWL